jgi:filamentous hemagglutinin family protein
MLKALPSALMLVFAQPGWTQATLNTGALAGLPVNGVVKTDPNAVQATLSNNNTYLTITQTGNRAIIHWDSFNIAAGNTVKFAQPSATAAVLNRVTSAGNPSEIFGTLTANGIVMLMNPNGIAFKSGSVVDVGSLIATTGVIDENHFLNSGAANANGNGNDSIEARITLTPGNNNGIVNEGSITATGIPATGNTAARGGLVALVAPSVVNKGTITAIDGTVALLGTNAATISLNNGLYEFALPPGSAGVAVSNMVGASLNAANINLGVGDAANLLSGVINLEGVQQATNAIIVDGHTVELKSPLQATNVVSGNSNIVNVYGGARIQDAVNIAKTGTPGNGASVNVRGGSYTEEVVLNKANITLNGMDGANINVLEGKTGVEITANGVTLDGMQITGPNSQNFASINWTGLSTTGVKVASGVTDATIRNNTIKNLRSGVQVTNASATITGNTIENTKGAILVRSNNVTMTGNSRGSLGNEWDIVFLDGVASGSYFGSPLGREAQYGAGMIAMSAANGDMHILDRRYGVNGLLGSTPQFANRSHVTVSSSGATFTAADDFNLGNGLGNVRQPLATIQAGMDAVVVGGTVNVAAGTHVQPSTLVISKSLTLAGAGESATVIDTSGVNGYGIQVKADNVTLKDFTLYGPSANAASSYGIKVAPGTNGAAARLLNFTIRQVTIRGSGRAELDLNGVDGALIDRVTADGAPLGGGAMTEGAGIQITDSANVTVRNSTTRDNKWGGLALYQANRHYNQQVNNITVEANNNFTEVKPVYMQDESASRDFGTLNIEGFDFAVRDATLDQYTWLQATEQKAFDFVVNEGGASSSVVQGWNGATTTQEFYLGIGNLTGGGTQAMSIGNTLNRAGSGTDIRVGAGRYAEDVVVDNPYNLYFSGSTISSLTLNTGAAGSGIGGTVTADGAGGFKFDAPVNLLADTTLTTMGANISFNGDIQNAGGVARGLRLIAGSDSTRGNVHMTTGGSAGGPLGQFDVSANQFSLDSTLWVKGYRIDALGNVTLSSSTLRAQDTNAANTLNAGGNVTGSTISLGSVEVVSAGNIEGNFAGTNVVAQAQGAMDVVVTASQTATLTAETMVANVTATDVVAQSQGNMNMVATASNSASLAGDSVVANVTAPVVAVDAVSDAQISGSASQITLDAPRGSVTGSFGQVNNVGGGLVNVNGKPQGNQTISSNAENNRVIRSGNVLDDAGSDQGGVQVADAGGFVTLAENGVVSLSSPEAAGEAIDSGQAVELDLSPRKQREGGKEEEKDKKKPVKP